MSKENVAGPVPKKKFLGLSNKEENAIAQELTRSTKELETTQIGTFYLYRAWSTSPWRLAMESKGDNAGAQFQVTQDGRIQYTSEPMNGASYAGFFDVIKIQKVPFHM